MALSRLHDPQGLPRPVPPPATRITFARCSRSRRAPAKVGPSAPAASFLALLAFAAASWAGPFEIGAPRKVPLDAPALGAVVSPDGRFTFILQAGGVIEVLDAVGTPVQTLRVDGDFNGIAMAPTGGALILTGAGRSEATIVPLEVIAQIDPKGSPARGPDKAPVTIAMYSDFQ